MAKVESNIEEFERQNRKAIEAGLDAAAEVIVRKARLNLSRRGINLSKTARKELKKAKPLINLDKRGKVRSVTVPYKKGGGLSIKPEILRAAQEIAEHGQVDAPGGFPRLRTGTLMRSITYEAGEPGERLIGSTMPPKTGYAAIHELGGTVRHPGGTPYLPIGSKGVIFLSKKHGLAGALGRLIKYTKPHAIRIPARPYLRPAARETEAEQTARFMDAMIAALAAQPKIRVSLTGTTSFRAQIFAEGAD